MPARKLTVYAYQDLIDQGWRRSGCFLYKPDLARSCCKAYTIRLDVLQFRPDKRQRRLLRKWRSYLSGEALSAPDAGAGAAAPAPAPSPVAVSASDLPTVSADTDGVDGTAGASAPSGARSPVGRKGGRQQSASGRRYHEVACSQAAVSRCPAAVLAMDSEAEGREEQRALQGLLAAALTAAVAAGDLSAAERGAPHAPPAVRRCSDKQRASLPADVRYTSAAAYPLAAAITRARAAVAATGGAGADGGRVQVPQAGGPDEAAERPGGSNGPPPAQQRRRALKTIPPREGALSAEHVAQVLTRHFNELASAEWPPGDVMAGDREGMPDQASPMAAVSGNSVFAAAAAEGRWLLPGKPEAYAAGGHVNIRLPQPQPPAQHDHQRQLLDVGTAAPDNAMENGPEAEPRPPVRRCRVPGASPGSGGAATGAGAGGGDGGAEGSAEAGWRSSVPGGKPGAGPASSAAQARSPPPRSAAAGAAPGGSGATAADAPDTNSLAVPAGRLEIRMVPSQFLQEEFELYKRYQIEQHGDKPGKLSRASYSRFLVDSPLPHVGRERDPAAPECGYGSFHQQYWLDGKLIAVGVVDVLPRCLSSVYLFWDTRLAPLALGRFSALQEILWVQRALPSSPGLHYYYMGFYIHTCQKMRYKADYRPSDLLCPVRKVWVRITPQLLAAIDHCPFLELSAQEGALCQPNLAAPKPSAVLAVTAAASAAAQSSPGPAAASAPASASSGDGGGGVDDTLVLINELGVHDRPLPFQVLRRLNVFPQRVMLILEKAISTWRAAVGWAAPGLVYQI